MSERELLHCPAWNHRFPSRPLILEEAANKAIWAIHDVAWPASVKNYERRVLAAQAVNAAIRSLSHDGKADKEKGDE